MTPILVIVHSVQVGALAVGSLMGSSKFVIALQDSLYIKMAFLIDAMRVALMSSTMILI
jgi:hypothetical protein